MKLINKKFIPSFLIILILMPSILFFVPNKVVAQGEDPGTVTGTVTEAPAVPITDVNAPNAKSTAKQSFWSRVLNGTTAAKTSISAGTDLKQWALKILEETLRNLAKKLMQKMTESTVNWINTGFHGAPLFLENPGSFFKDIGKYEIKRLVNMIGYNTNSYPFGKSFLIGAINSYKSTFAQNAQYSLSKVTNDPTLLENFRTNFSTGGWDGFLLTTQFPQNNQIGSQLMYADYLANKLPAVQSASDIVKDKLAQGHGFLSPQKCETNPNFNNKAINEFQQPVFKCSLPEPELPNLSACGMRANQATVDCIEKNEREQSNYDANYTIWKNLCDSDKAAWGKTNACPNRPNGTSGFVTTTPGSVVADQIMTSLSSPFRQGELGIAMGNSLSAIFDALLHHFMDKGLTALKSAVSGNGNNAPDNFNYNGHTLDNTTTTGGSSGTFNWNQAPDVPTDIDNLPPYDGSKFIDKKSLEDPTTCPTGQTGTPPYCTTPTTSPPLSITTSALSNANVGVSYSASISATGGTGSYSWTSSGILPAGLTLTSTNCFVSPCQAPVTISGIPTQAGPYNFTISVSSDPLVGDGATLTATKSFTLTIVN